MSWSVSPPELGTVSSSGVFTATGYGSGMVVATSGATSGSAIVTVNGAAPVPAVASSLGHGYLTVPTVRGTFGVQLIKERLSDVTIRTVTVSSSDREADRFARPLRDHLS